MRGTFAFDFNRTFWFARMGHLEVHVERHREGAPAGYLGVTGGRGTGEVVASVGKLAIHLVNHARVNRHFTSRISAQG
jgi:hypothetical protein